ncbi:MAG: hypothetical protein OHK0023_18670 [Anaerolineae bacterium]
MNPFNVMVVLDSPADLHTWVAFALRFVPTNGELHLRGMVTVPAEKSLSEGALPAREWREGFRRIALSSEIIHDESEVFVDYRPFERVIDDVRSHNIDLLLVAWTPSEDTVGGVAIVDIMQATPCNLVLASDIQAVSVSKDVLLSLRGGPNLSLGIYTARAIAADNTITLFHAVDQTKIAPDLEAVMRSVPQVTRTITAVTGIVDGIIRESRGHDAIIMGSGLQSARSGIAAQFNVYRTVYERTSKPIILVRAWQQEPLEFHAPRALPRPEETLSVRVDRWFAENTFHSSEFGDLKSLLALKEKQDVTISLALPALNEAATIGNVITTLKTTLMDHVPLLDEIVLIDSDSTDNTRQIAAELNIPTYIHQHILADVVGANRGKGEALWKSLYVTRGDIIVWVDTDITNIHPRFVYGLIGPLLKNQRVQYVKGFYARPINVNGRLQAHGGGRVTELVARPLLNLFYPELSGIVQPLSGEYAGRRTALEQLPFFSGYGVETGMLIDVLNRFGLESIAQSDLEVRVHHNQPLINLSKMSFAILQVFIARLESRYGVELLQKANRSMKLVVQEADRFALDISEIGDVERPPMITLPAYLERLAVK